MNDNLVAGDPREAVRHNLEAQAGLGRKIATMTRDSDLAAEWNDFAAEVDALIQSIAPSHQPVNHPVDQPVALAQAA